MRAIAVSVWIFINLVFVGMCGYIYLLWSQYWRYVERQNGQITNSFNTNRNYNSYSSGTSGGANSQIYYYYHGSSSETGASGPGTYAERQRRIYHNNKTLPKHHLREKSRRRSITVIRHNSQPRFPKAKNSDTDTSDRYSKCGDSSDCGGLIAISDSQLDIDKYTSKIATYKSQLVVQLRRVLLEESSVFRARGDASNPYNVRYAGPRGSYQGRTPRELICELHQAANIHTLNANDEPFRKFGLSSQFPTQPLFGSETQRYNSCAIVTNAGSLDGAGLGKFIDKHDLVLRFNHAPTEAYERDVGTKTNIRILNSQVVSKPEFDFLHSPLYEDVSLLVWDPSNYSATLDEWYANPDFDLFTPYFKHRLLYPKSNFHILDPRSQWSLWEYIQSHIPVRIRKNPPSSGFLGLALLLPHCSYVDLFEYVPSMRLTKRCHYWEAAEDLSCTFGVWHPLAAEKLLALALNVAKDPAVYSAGYIRVPGYETLKC